MAHLAVVLPSGLSLHSAGRKSAGRATHVRKFDGDHAAWRLMAWRELDICDLGRLSRGDARRIPEVRDAVGWIVNAGEARRDVHARCGRMGILQGREHSDGEGAVAIHVQPYR